MASVVAQLPLASLWSQCGEGISAPTDVDGSRKVQRFFKTNELIWKWIFYLATAHQFDLCDIRSDRRCRGKFHIGSSWYFQYYLHLHLFPL